MGKQVNPMPTVTYEGKTYKLKSRKTVIPDFSVMDSMSVHWWIYKNTTPRGYCKAPNPLLGMGGAISIKG